MFVSRFIVGPNFKYLFVEEVKVVFGVRRIALHLVSKSLQDVYISQAVNSSFSSVFGICYDRTGIRQIFASVLKLFLMTSFHR